MPQTVDYGDSQVDTKELGLPMVARKNPEILAEERQRLADVEGRGMGPRLWLYLALAGPGFLQGALTLGGGTAANSLMAGSRFGYQLLWVQPLAMLLGIVMLNALAYQTLSTGMRPFEAVRRYVHPMFAWGWALASLIASIVWCFPQYNLAADVVADMSFQAGIIADQASMTPRLITSLVVLVLTIAITWSYNKGSRGMRLYENTLKIMVALIVLAFASVVAITGISWAKFGSGFIPSIPTLPDGSFNKDAISVIIASFATAVGINMTFLLPYSMLARGWGREHRGLARFDLSIGLFVPFVLATTFIIIATANTLGAEGKVTSSALDLARALEPAAIAMVGESNGPAFAHWVFGLGVLGMTLSTIPLLMLVCGFIAVEIFDVDPNGWGYRLATLAPTPGFLGPLLWGKLGFWLAVPTSVFCALLLPIAYISFLVLQNRRKYLKEDMPRGTRRLVWNTLMGLAVLVVCVGAVTGFINEARKVRDRLAPKAPAAVVTPVQTPQVAQALE